MTKEKEIKLNQLDIQEKLLKTDLDFSSDSEHNLEFANSLGLLFALDGFSKSKNLSKRMVKSMTFLASTNDLQQEIMSDLADNFLNAKGKRGKDWKSIITDMTKSNWKRKELENEKRFNRLSIR